MKKFGGGVLLRIFVIALLIIVQITALVLAFLYFTGLTVYFSIVCSAISLFVTITIVRRDSSPEYKIAWIIPILIFPIFGGPLYLFFGRIRPTRREAEMAKTVSMRRDQAVNAMPHSRNASLAFDALSQKNKDAAIKAKYIKDTSRAPVYTGTQAKYYAQGVDMFPEMLKDLETAEKSIFLEYFIVKPGYMWDTILEILKRKAAQGVDVRLMYDDFGCMFILPYNYPKILAQFSIKCCVFNRFTSIFSSRFNNRDHRKLCIIDGNIGYTGGINLADEYIGEVERFGHWKDSAIRLEGEAVWSLSAMFLSLWCYTEGCDENFLEYKPTHKMPDDGFIQPFMDVPMDNDAVGEVVYKQILGRAKRYVYITTPYLIIGSSLIGALCEAAKSGIDVRIITPRIPDKKTVFSLTQSYFEVLLAAGVKIYEYTPGFIHSKIIVSDDVTAVVGTINLDFRSLYLHHECAVSVYEAGCVQSVRDDFLSTLELSREISLSSREKLPFIKRLALNLLRIFSPLM